MTRTISEESFRQAAEAEDGVPVSAGARVAQVRSALDSGRTFFVDLSSVPEKDRQGVVAEIKALVDRASAHVREKEVDSSRTSANVNG
jgi:hypothetical protein